MQADAATTAAMTALLAAYREAYLRRDVEGLLALFAPEPDITVMGTGTDELSIGVAVLRNQFTRDITQADEIVWDFPAPVVACLGSVAWTLVQANVHARMGSIREDLALRASVVAVRVGDRWLIHQMHCSLPSPGQPEGESFPPPSL